MNPISWPWQRRKVTKRLDSPTTKPILKLWRVTNGYTGNGSVRVLVLAPDAEKALDLAHRQYRNFVSDMNASHPGMHSDDYCNRLHAVKLVDCVTNWASYPNDD